MLTQQQIDERAAEVATEFLPPGAIVQVSSQPDFGTDGEATLRVLVVLRAAALADVTGAQAIHVLSGLQDRLSADGEMRFASIEYATDEELAVHGGS